MRQSANDEPLKKQTTLRNIELGPNEKLSDKSPRAKERAGDYVDPGSPRISGFHSKDPTDQHGRQPGANEFFLTQNMPGLGQTVERERHQASEMKKGSMLAQKPDKRLDKGKPGESVSQMAHVSNQLVKNTAERHGDASVPAGASRASIPRKLDQVLPLSIGVTTEPLYECQSHTM